MPLLFRRGLWYHSAMDLNVTSPKTVKALMSEHGIAPLKKYGQNFLIDGNVSDKIAEAAAPQGAYVLEIGPGLGALTQRLLRRGCTVTAYEIDAGLCRALRAMYADEPRFSLFHGDFLKADLKADLMPLFGQNEMYVAANLPYYITSPCIMKLLESGLPISRVTVMVQKEVAQRVCAMPGSPDYGSLSAAVQFFAEPRLLFTVSASCFLPQPEVSSAVMTLALRDKLSGDAKSYLATVRILFAMRRKTVRSNLRQALNLSPEEAEALLGAAGVDADARAENLGVNDFLEISKKICEKTIII
jgi:16S rRNA (adenine1518-N6/adenine1519-N6)-dimethyltransferase